MVATESIKSAISDLLGTFILVFVSCYSFSLYQLEKLSVIGVALANGFALAGCIWAFQVAGSCLMNPTLTLFSLFTMNVKVGRTLANLAAQVMGSCLAAVVAACVIPDEYSARKLGLVGYPTINLEDFSEFQCFIFEFLAGGLLMMAYYATVIDKRGPPHVYGFAMGATVVVSTLMFINGTGGCGNIVRVIGPQIIFGEWSSIPIYWLGIGFGSLFAGFYYEHFLLKNEEVEEDLEELDHGRTMKTVENINQASMLKY